MRRTISLTRSDFDDVTQYVQQVDPQQATSMRALYAPIIADSLPNPYRAYVALDAATKQKYQMQAQAVYDLLQTHQQSYTQRSSAPRFVFALQNARVVAQFTTYADAPTQQEALARYYQRDGFMAENVEWIRDYAAGPNPKMIVWAHDVHIANDTAYPSQDGRNMGGELHTHFAEGYLPIGTTLYQGTFRVYDYPTGIVQAIPPAPVDTYNFTLGQAGLPVYLLDLRMVPFGAVADWARGAGSARRLLNFGLGGEDLSSAANLGQWFDMIVHVQASTPSQHL